jgi:hypothetical protein
MIKKEVYVYILLRNVEGRERGSFFDVMLNM